MNVRRPLFAAALPAVLLFAACASTQSSSVPPPVNVSISTDPAVKYFVRVDELTEVTKQALMKYAGNAGPANIVVRFDSLGGSNDPHSRADVTWSPETVAYTRAVPSMSSDPWSDGVRPVVASYSFGGPPPAGLVGTRLALRGTYTITDANGVVLEHKPIYMAPDYGSINGNRIGEQQQAATYLAKRVAKLTRNHS